MDGCQWVGEIVEGEGRRDWTCFGFRIQRRGIGDGHARSGERAPEPRYTYTIRVPKS